MRILDWARQEIELAKKNESEYGAMCYESAFKAFKCLCNDNHSGMSIGFTQEILNSLIDGKVLTPIENTDDIWEYVYDRENGAKVYQCSRMSSLFKDLLPDGTVTFNDNNRVVIMSKNCTIWSSGKASELINDIYPIKFPYMPSNRPYIVQQDDFCYKKPDAVGMYDYYAYLSYKDPNGKEFLIDKYYMETETGDVEISKELWLQKKAETFGEKG